ncbi:MAG: NmrA family transcriptional regulator [Dyadobacter sp. 50-39]|uniref:SDR family oxidoreductase n=1 Tax=Dyadobacter sp. 50-39 TaxID=1895756 RepID=UPI000965FBEA|nr:SDR family oxidoreductase [Dyadobacter sp. 50-39]OJV15851.1 MAG: NmrA family transcriptional regulator [Dyadobacter sp. 50-39]
MKIVIIGGTGLIGSNVAKKLRQLGHSVIAGSPSTGINALTGEGLSDALENTDVVVDLSNSPSFEDGPAIQFFETVGRNILSAELNAGVKHHVTLSIVGTHLMEGMGYMRAKKIQEDLVKSSGVPYTIVRSTQFHEFVPTIVAGGAQGNQVHVSKIDFQPIAAEDVALFIARFAISEPSNGTVEIAGPVRGQMSEFVEKYVKATDAEKSVIASDRNEYFGLTVPASTLVPDGNAYLGETRFQQYLDSLSAKV